MLGLLLACVGCVHPTGSAPRGNETARASAGVAREPSPVPASAEVAANTAPPRIAVEPETVSVDGRVVAPSGSQADLELLGAALDKRTPRPVISAGYELSVTDATSGKRLKGVLFAAAARGYPNATVHMDSGAITLSVDVNEDPSWQRHALVLAAHEHVLEIWRTDLPKGNEGLARPSATKLASVPAGVNFLGRLTALANACAGSLDCSRSLLLISDDSEFGMLRIAVGLLAAARPALPISLEVGFEDPWSAEQLVEIVTRGRLAPELIQRLVRQNYVTIRKCYEIGLARNPNLTGRVTAHFVIGADGTVWSVSDTGSDMRDADVVTCVLNTFSEMVFPRPQGGTVTVVYPIQFAPG